MGRPGDTGVTVKSKMDWNFIIFSLVKIAIVVGVVQGIVAYSVLAERKISAWIQDRVGPNRARAAVYEIRTGCRSVADPDRHFPAAGRRLEVHVQGGFHAGGCEENLFLAGAGHFRHSRDADRRGDSLRLAASARRKWSSPT